MTELPKNASVLKAGFKNLTISPFMVSKNCRNHVRSDTIDANGNKSLEMTD